MKSTEELIVTFLAINDELRDRGENPMMLIKKRIREKLERSPNGRMSRKGGVDE